MIPQNPFSLSMSQRPFPFTFTLSALACFGWGLFALLLIVAGEGLALAKEEGSLRELPRPKFGLTPPLFQEWTFDTDTPQEPPNGFSSLTLGNGPQGNWFVRDDDNARSHPNVLVQTAPCLKNPCYHLLLAADIDLQYVDLTVGLKQLSDSPSGQAGLIFGAKAPQTFYAVTVGSNGHSLEAVRIQGTEVTLLAKKRVEPRGNGWNFLRIQRNTIMSKEVLEIFFDNQLILSISDSTIGSGTIGIVTTGQSAFAFDNLRIVELLTNRPLSRPPAY